MATPSRTRLTIRPATAADYPTLARLQNAVFSEYATTADTIRFGDEHRDPKCRRGALRRRARRRDRSAWPNAVNRPGCSTRASSASASPSSPRGRDRGSAPSSTTTPCAPSTVRAPLRPGQTPAPTGRGASASSAERGYTEADALLGIAPRGRQLRSRALRRCGSPHVGDGIVIRTYAELAGDPDRDRKLYELDRDLCRGCPVSRAAYSAQLRVLRRAGPRRPRSPAGCLVRRDRRGNRQYAGMGQLWHSQASDDLYNGLTGVRRSLPAARDRAGAEAARHRLRPGAGSTDDQDLERVEQPRDARDQRGARLREAARLDRLRQGAARR